MIVYTKSHKRSFQLFLCAFAALFLFSAPLSAKDRKSKKKKNALSTLVKAPENNDSTQYSKELANFKASNGMFKVHTDKTGKVYFEMADSVFNHDYLLTNRVSSTSNTKDFVAGQMITTPMLVRFSRDYNNVYLHQIPTNNIVDATDPIKPAFERAFKAPILKGFKIKARTPKSCVIDVTSFFGENEKCISPIRPDNPISKLFGSDSKLKGTFNASGSFIEEVKNFPQNLQIKSTLSYHITATDQPYTVSVSRSLVQLPDTLMPSRLQDNRVGYFCNYKNHFTSKRDNIEQYSIISRWNLQPRPEDLQKYHAGELVEPQKKIVYYIDSAFPTQWAKAVKEGVEYWNKAFEAAGFKHVVEARMYPTNDPSFDPDDARYNCIRYCVTNIANAMGPSYVDPRSGEILSADVIWYHNVVSLLHNWKFVQTAAVDPRVRKPVFDEATMYEAMTYVAAHEIGHTLGLMHNMGASYAFTIDNLRDPAFTQKYGTTPSIMDYARNNYVAQPGDMERGVKLTPPQLGVYDIYAINWGYRLIPEANNMFEEKPTLDRWIREKENDPMFTFGAQQLLGLVDPTDQSEDLSNDQIKAGTMSINNLKIIMDNLEAWTLEKDRNYDDVLDTYKAVLQQYNRHVGHVMPYIGGIIYKEVRQGHDDGSAKSYVEKAKVKEAMQWLLNEVRTNDWLNKASIKDKEIESNNWREKLTKNVAFCLLNSRNLCGINDGYEKDPSKGYKLSDYTNDAYALIFKKTLDNKTLDLTEQTLQSTAIDIFMRGSGLKPADKNSKDKLMEEYYQNLQALSDEPLPCAQHHHHHLEGDDAFVRLVLNLPTLPVTQYQPLMTAMLTKTLALYKSRSNATSDSSTKNFYNYQIMKITSFLKAN